MCIVIFLGFLIFSGTSWGFFYRVECVCGERGKVLVGVEFICLFSFSGSMLVLFLWDG